MTENAAEASGGNMQTHTIMTAKLGKIEYRDEDVITLSSPLLGFTGLHDFLLVTNDESFPFIWFQSTEDPDVCFILVDAQMFFNDYKPKINPRELKILGAEELSEVKVLGIVVVHGDPKDATINLRAPLLINQHKMLGKQVILDDDNYDIKTPLFAGRGK